jgi:flagellar protein FliJ
MAFRFALETVLHFRRSVEHQQELRLRAANHQVASMRHQIEHIEQQMASMRARESGDLAAGTTAAELQFTRACEATLDQQRIAAQGELLRLERLRDQQRELFQQARRAREVFETLREQQRKDYERNARRREQRELDELFLMQKSHSRHG